MSPDTARIAYTTDTSYYRLSDVWVIETRLDAKPRHIAPGIGPSWSPDGAQLAYYSLVGDTLQLFVWDRKSGATRQVTHVPGGFQPSDYVSVYPGKEGLRLSWSPDGKRIVLATRVQEPADPVGDSLPIVITQHSPAPKIWAGILHYTFGGWQYVKGIPSGRMLTVAEALKLGNEVLQLEVVDVGSGATTQITQGTEGAFDPAWSPDGKTIVFESNEGTPMMASRLRETNLYRIDASGGNRTALTTGEGRKYAPLWSSDGRTVAALFKPDGPYIPTGTWLIDLDRKTIERDSARVETALSQSFPLSDRRGLVRITPTYPPTRLEFGLPGTPSRTLLDFTPPKAQDDKEQGTRMSWIGARGKKLNGRLRLPVGYEAGKRYPLVVDPYHEWQTPDTLTAAGYIIFSPSVRAPHDQGDFEENREAYHKLVLDSSAVAIRITVEDVMSGVDTLIRRGMVDSGRMALAGFSNGGGVVNYLVTNTDRFKCAVAQSPAAGDMTTTFLQDPDGEYLLTFFGGRTPWSHPAMYTALSSVYVVDRVHVPMLFAIGDREAIPFQANALEMYDGLRRLKRPVTLVRYPGQDHGLKGWALADLATRTRKFIDACTGGKGS